MRRAFIALVTALDRGMDRAGVLVHRYRRPLRDGLVLAGLLRTAWYFSVQGIQPWTFPWVDARAYWGVDLAQPYATSGVGDLSTFLYAPAFAQALAPVSLLPFPLFAIAWTGLLVAVLAWLVRPWPWALLILALPTIYEVCVGNVHLLIAAAIVISFRTPWTWALPVYTKITPGIGLGWFLVRGEWRLIGVALVSLGGILAVSFALSPDLWFQWFSFLLSSPSRSQLLLPRIMLGLLLVGLGALTGRRWMVPVAVWISLPVVWINAWVILFAVICLKDRVAPVIPLPPAPESQPGP